VTGGLLPGYKTACVRERGVRPRTSVALAPVTLNVG
jgi:hypothetical protein